MMQVYMYMYNTDNVMVGKERESVAYQNQNVLHMYVQHTQ